MLKIDAAYVAGGDTLENSRTRRFVCGIFSRVDAYGRVIHHVQLQDPEHLSCFLVGGYCSYHGYDDTDGSVS